MEYRQLTIKELHQLVAEKKITVENLAKLILQDVKNDRDANFMVTLPEREILNQARKIDQNFDAQNLLAGVPYMVKDNFNTKGIRTTAGSKILDNFIPPFSATVVTELENQQALMMGKVALDELGMGGTGLHSAYGQITNPYDSKRLIGGSSSGSVYAVAKGYVPYATGTDTGDSIRKPASYTGLVGFKPTYGALSRYGVIPYAPSLDHLGFFTRNVEDMALICDATFKWDPHDFTSQEIPEKDFAKNLTEFPQKTKFGYLKIVQDNLAEPLKTHYQNFYNQLQKRGYEVLALDFPQELLEAIPPAYMMISFTEAVSSHANLDGINFGKRVDAEDYIQLMTKTRTQYLGPVVKRRFLIGSLNLKKNNQERFMLKAKKVRRLIAQELEKIYHQVDLLIVPPALDVAPLIEKAEEFDDTDQDEATEFLNDILVLANFNGMPSITIPFVFKNGLPIGINFNAAPKKDLLVLQAAKLAESILGFKNKVVKD